MSVWLIVIAAVAAVAWILSVRWAYDLGHLAGEAKVYRTWTNHNREQIGVDDYTTSARGWQVQPEGQPS